MNKKFSSNLYKFKFEKKNHGSKKFADLIKISRFFLKSNIWKMFVNLQKVCRFGNVNGIEKQSCEFIYFCFQNISGIAK